MEDIVEVIRIIRYRGKRSWVEETVSRSVHGLKVIGDNGTIFGAGLTEFPEVVRKKIPRPYVVNILAWAGEYRVPCPNGTEQGAYYTDDWEDAVKAATSMYSFSPLTIVNKEVKSWEVQNR